jgi:hypothetical protein
LRIIAALIFLGLLELLSWETASWPSPCAIEISHKEQAAHHYQEKDCPTFFSGMLILLGRIDHFIESHDKSIVAGFTVVLAISTIGLWLATIKLWKAGERQMELIEANAAEQSRDMKASIKIGEDSAKAAAKSADAAERGVIAADRAWIEISIDITGPLKFGPEWIEIPARATVKNVGKSPATNVSFYINLYPDSAVASHKIDDEVKHLKDMYPIALGSGYGQVLFPDATDVRERVCRIKRRDFIARIKEVDAVETDDKDREPFTKSRPALMVIAWYAIPSAGQLGRYRYSSEIRAVASNFFKEGFDGTEEAEIAIDNLELVRTPFGGQTA